MFMLLNMNKYILTTSHYQYTTFVDCFLSRKTQMYVYHVKYLDCFVHVKYCHFLLAKFNSTLTTKLRNIKTATCTIYLNCECQLARGELCTDNVCSSLGSVDVRPVSCSSQAACLSKPDKSI